MSDIVERLRYSQQWEREETPLHIEAADEIEKLRVALQAFADAMNILSSRPGITMTEVANVLNEVGAKARAALNNNQ